MPRFSAEEVRQMAREARMDYKSPCPEMLEAFAELLEEQEKPHVYEWKQFPRILRYYRGISIIENLDPNDDKIYFLDTSKIKIKEKSPEPVRPERPDEGFKD